MQGDDSPYNETYIVPKLGAVEVTTNNTLADDASTRMNTALLQILNIASMDLLSYAAMVAQDYLDVGGMSEEAAPSPSTSTKPTISCFSKLDRASCATVSRHRCARAVWNYSAHVRLPAECLCGFPLSRTRQLSHKQYQRCWGLHARLRRPGFRHAAVGHLFCAPPAHIVHLPTTDCA